MIKLNKCIKSKVLKSFFYLEGNIKINSEYFIERIKQDSKVFGDRAI